MQSKCSLGLCYVWIKQHQNSDEKKAKSFLSFCRLQYLGSLGRPLKTRVYKLKRKKGDNSVFTPTCAEKTNKQTNKEKTNKQTKTTENWNKGTIVFQISVQSGEN